MLSRCSARNALGPTESASNNRCRTRGTTFISALDVEKFAANQSGAGFPGNPGREWRWERFGSQQDGTTGYHGKTEIFGYGMIPGR